MTNEQFDALVSDLQNQEFPLTDKQIEIMKRIEQDIEYRKVVQDIQAQNIEIKPEMQELADRIRRGSV